MGCLTNTLVLRTDLSGNPRFQQLLERVREVCLGAYAHQELPFELMVEQLHPERSLSYHPLFQTLFVLQNAPLADLELPGLRVELLPIETGTSKFDLMLDLRPGREGELQGYLEYATELFAAETVSRMAGHLEMLLTGVVDDPYRQIGDLPLLSPAERDQILHEWNATRMAYPADQCIHTLFEGQVTRTPHAIAVVFDGPMSRGQGSGVRGQGDKETRRHGDRSHGSDVGERQTQNSKLKTQNLPSPPHLVTLSGSWPTIAAAPPSNLPCRATPDNLAYVIYTSGSTGRPKGALNIHRAIANRLLWMQDAYRLAAEDRVMQKTSFSFDVSVWEFLWPLLAGARLVLAQPEGHKDPAYLAALIAAERITTLRFVPSMLRRFLEQPRLEACRSLRRVICSGEPLPLEVQERFFARLDAELHNLYGPDRGGDRCDCVELRAQHAPGERADRAADRQHADRYPRPAPGAGPDRRAGRAAYRRRRPGARVSAPP